jgi:nitrite reductase/ring-hydroxylating ferredoxin subunit
MKVPLAHLADIPEGDVKEIDFFERSVYLTKVGNLYNAFVNVCTHAGGPLLVEEGRLRCAWHQACFDLKSGKKLEGPGPYPLIRLPVRVEGDQLVYVYGE